jgi:hypothetical protein
LQNYLSGESFSPVPGKSKHFLHIKLTPPYPHALDIVNCNIHGMLAFRKAEGGET